VTTPIPSACPVCGCSPLHLRFRSPRVDLFRCPSCGHHVVRHAAAADDRDYHDQYDEGGFLSALRATRERQSRELVDLLTALGLGDELRVLDFGCGRGYLLAALQRRGVVAAGADYSPKSAELVGAMGIEAHVVPSIDASPLAELRSRLSFAPTVLTLLDVIEHFPPPTLVANIRLLRAAFGSTLSHIAVKVPVADGLLFRAAVALARLGLPAALEQMLQVGTSPAHQHYFTRESLARCLKESLGGNVVASRRDVEFEPAAFGSRVHALAGWPSSVTAVLGHAFATAARLLEAEDSVTVLLRPGVFSDA
jgi:2-polyprenyl-3-methyl-5-hydroxy-6-metoxy-1,4-benzoquinol methylase